jgi:hypothetical protein
MAKKCKLKLTNMKNIILISLVIFLTSCGLEKKFDVAINSIEKATGQGAQLGVKYADILNGLKKDLPDDARDMIGNDLKILSNDVIGATASGLICSTDAIKNGAIQTLRNLKAKALGKKFFIPKPEFCTLNMASIDLNSDPKSRNTLTFYGFNLFNADTSNRLIQAVLIGDSTKKIIEEKYIGRNTNYQLSINLNSLIADLVENKYNKIQLYWNGDTAKMPQVLIQKWKAKTDVKEFLPTPISFIPPHIGASDLDFDTDNGNPAVGNIRVEFNVTPTSVLARVHMDAMEFGGDNTRVGGPDNEATSWSPWTPIYTLTNKNFEIKELSPNTTSKQELLIASQGQKLYSMGGGSVAYYTVDLDQGGDEAGTYTKVVVTWNTLSVILLEKKPTGE